MLFALCWGLFIALVMRLVREEIVVLPGSPSPLETGLQTKRANPIETSRLLGWLALQHCVILIGNTRAAHPMGTVAVPRSDDLGDLTSLVEALDELGRPLVVPVVGKASAAGDLAVGLSDIPVLRVQRYVGEQVVGEDGGLERL